MKKTASLLNIFLILGLMLAASAKAALASPHLSLSPASGTYTVGQSFEVTVNVDAGGKIIGGVDMKGLYDSAKLEFVSMKRAELMVFEDYGGSCDLNNTSSAAGKFSFGCTTNTDIGSESLSGKLVVITFKAKAVGTATVSYECTTDTSDTNILQAVNVADVIVCGENVTGSYVIKAASSSDDTTDETTDDTEETTEDTSSETDTSSELPQTGSVGTTLGLILFGAISIASALFLKLI